MRTKEEIEDKVMEMEAKITSDEDTDVYYSGVVHALNWVLMNSTAVLN